MSKVTVYASTATTSQARSGDGGELRIEVEQSTEQMKQTLMSLAEKVSETTWASWVEEAAVHP